MTIPVQKIALTAGAAYVGYGAIRAIASGPVAAMGCFMVASLLFVVLGPIFNWAYYDQSVHLGLCCLGASIIAIGALFYAGEIITALLSIVVMGVYATLLGAYCHQIDIRWDTSERRFDERMARGCQYDYNYSTTDGYCHFNHKTYDEEFTAHNSGFTELMIPKVQIMEGDSPEPRENIERLRTGAPRTVATGAEWTPPTATVESLTTEATAQPVHRSFLGYMIYRLTRPSLWIGILIMTILKCCWEFHKERSRTIDSEREMPTQSGKPVYPWLAEGRKAAGLD